MKELCILEMTNLQVGSYIMAALIENFVTYEEWIIFLFSFSSFHLLPML